MGFLPADHPRVLATVHAIEAALTIDGFVHRFLAGDTPGHGEPPLGEFEGAFLPCTFWLADALSLTGRQDEAVALFERLLALTNDVGLLAEEYDTATGRQVGNFPQAFSHIGLVDTAFNLAHGQPTPAHDRAAGEPTGATEVTAG